MTKTTEVAENPSLTDQTSSTPVNSIVAAATTAHDLEIARKEAAKTESIRHSLKPPENE